MVDSADLFDLLVQADFRACGQTAHRDPALDAVAARVARGFALKSELQAAKLRPCAPTSSCCRNWAAPRPS